MILVDTSVWIGHLRTGNDELAGLLERGAVLGHPWVLGELALGRLERRGQVLDLLGNLPQATGATEAEVLGLIEREELWGSGIGYVDAQLLAAGRLTPASLWTNDRRLAAAASRLGMAFEHETDDG
jgi:predicted nucleic acid-binding protein